MWDILGKLHPQQDLGGTHIQGKVYRAGTAVLRFLYSPIKNCRGYRNPKICVPPVHISKDTFTPPLSVHLSGGARKL